MKVIVGILMQIILENFGGFNYCDETCILRWLHRGDTIYEVEIPDDVESVRLEGATIIYRAIKLS